MESTEAAKRREELEVLARVLEIIENLDSGARWRVLEYARSRSNSVSIAEESALMKQRCLQPEMESGALAGLRIR